MTGDDASTGPRRSPGSGEVAVFAEAGCALLAAALAIAILPFRHLTRTIRHPRRAPASADQARTADAVVVAVQRAARRLPLRTVCLHKALATHWLLRSRGIATRVHYGISPSGALLKAHVWVDLGGLTIIGEEESLGFARVATFPPAERGEMTGE